MGNDKLEKNQIHNIFLCAVVADAVLMTFNSGYGFSAHEKVIAALVNAVLLILVCALFFYNVKTNFNGKAWLIAAYIAFVTAAAGAFLDIERFYRFGTDVHLGGAVIIFLVLFVALYILKCSYGALSRASGLFLLFFAFFAAVLVVTSATKASATNLAPAYENEYGVLVSSIMLFKFPASLLLFASVPIKSEKTVPMKSIIKGIICLLLIQAGAALLSELVFGKNTAQYEQPFFATAQIAEFSVFEHLEPIYFSMFLLALMLKGLILFFAAFNVLTRCFEKRNTVHLKIITVAVTFAVIVAISFMVASVYNAVQILTSALAACLLCITVRTKGKKQKCSGSKSSNLNLIENNANNEAETVCEKSSEDMIKNIVRKMKKNGALLLICTLTPFLFSSCAESVPLSARTIVKAIYLNEDSGGNVTASLIMYTCKPGANTAEVQGDPVIYTAEGENVAMALKNVENMQSKEPFYDQNKILFLGSGTFENVSKYISHFMPESLAAQDLSVFLTEISTEEFNELSTNSTDVIKSAETIAEKSVLNGNRAVQLYEINLDENEKFSGYLPVITLKENYSVSVDELIIFDEETPVLSVTEMALDITLILAGKQQTLEVDTQENDKHTYIQTQKLAVAFDAQSGGDMNIYVNGTAKSTEQNSKALFGEEEQAVIDELCLEIENTAESIIKLTTFEGNDIFNLNSIMYNKQNMFCNDIKVACNIGAGT